MRSCKTYIINSMDLNMEGMQNRSPSMRAHPNNEDEGKEPN